MKHEKADAWEIGVEIRGGGSMKAEAKIKKSDKFRENERRCMEKWNEKNRDWKTYEPHSCIHPSRPATFLLNTLWVRI